MRDDEVNYGETVVDNMIISIQATLDQAVLVIDIAGINAQVTANIINDSDVYAVAQRDAVGFTIG